MDPVEREEALRGGPGVVPAGRGRGERADDGDDPHPGEPPDARDGLFVGLPEPDDEVGEDVVPPEELDRLRESLPEGVPREPGAHLPEEAVCRRLHVELDLGDAEGEEAFRCLFRGVDRDPDGEGELPAELPDDLEDIPLLLPGRPDDPARQGYGVDAVRDLPDHPHDLRNGLPRGRLPRHAAVPARKDAPAAHRQVGLARAVEGDPLEAALDLHAPVLEHGLSAPHVGDEDRALPLDLQPDPFPSQGEENGARAAGARARCRMCDVVPGRFTREPGCPDREETGFQLVPSHSFSASG